MLGLFRNKYTAPALIAAVGLFSSTLGYAEIYKWTDENGKIHFSDTPVDNKAKKLDIKITPSAPVSAKTRDERKQRADQYLRARQEEREEQNKKQKEKKRLAKLRKEKCGEAKHEYREITEAGTVYYKKKDGTRDYLEPERRKKEELRAKAEVKKWCK